LSGGPGAYLGRRRRWKRFPNVSFSCPIHRLQPLIFLSWGALLVAVCFFPHALVQAHHEICSEDGSSGYEAHATPAPINFPFATQWTYRLILVLPCHSRDLPRIKSLVSIGGRVAQFMGISKVLLFRQVIYHKSIRPLCQMEIIRFANSFSAFLPQTTRDS
jgi:hypothetical protein